MTIRAAIFDFGGVFVDSPFDAAVTAAASLDVDPALMLEIVFGSYELDTDHAWHRLERGEIPLEEARALIMQASTAQGGPLLDPFELLMALGGGGVREEMVDFVRAARSAGLATSILTNNAQEFADFWRPMLPLDELFDDVVDSSFVGLRKPDPRIFELSLKRLGVSASEAVFIDDAPGNVAAASQLGIASVLIGTKRTDMPRAIDELHQLTGVPKS
ncbi:MAG: HAD family phosphatase [Microthrixaceae bacterium]